MTAKKQTLAQAPVAQLANTDQGAETSAPSFKLGAETCEDFGRTVVSAYAKFDRDVAKAGLTRMETIMEALAEVKAQGLNRLTAADYAKTLGAALGRSIDKAVSGDKLQANTAAKVRSNIKAITLASLNGLVTLKADDGLAFAYETSVKALAAPEAAFVYDGVAKAGVKAGTASHAKGTGKRAKAGSDKANGQTVQGQTIPSEPSGTNKTAAQARAENLENAALALAMGDRERAARLVIICTKHAKDFDAWASEVITKA